MSSKNKSEESVTGGRGMKNGFRFIYVWDHVPANAHLTGIYKNSANRKREESNLFTKKASKALKILQSGLVENPLFLAGEFDWFR